MPEAPLPQPPPDALAPLKATLKPLKLAYSLRLVLRAWLELDGWTPLRAIKGAWVHLDRDDSAQNIEAAAQKQMRWEEGISTRAAESVKPPPARRR